jgi:tyrosyl-tRNA synthetase
MQAYDFYWLYTQKNCKLQMGGSDQWGNMTTGSELIRRKSGGEAYVFTNHLITKSDGGKFGKTEQGNVWLDPQRTTPYQFYQFWLNAPDADAEKWIRIFTFLDRQTIESLSKEHGSDPSRRILQKKLAEEVTLLVHGKKELEEAIATTEKLFSQQNAPAENLSAQDLETMAGVVKVNIAREKLENGMDIVSFLADSGIFPSKGEARKTIQGGGVSVNRRKVEGIDLSIDPSLLLHDKYLLVQKGKKNYFLVTVI